MFTITLTVCDQQEVEDILHALSEAEEEGLIDFPFQTQTREMTSVEESGWRKDITERINNRIREREAAHDLEDRKYIAEATRFENESRN